MDEPDNLSSTKDAQSCGEDSRESFSLLYPPKIGRYRSCRRLGRGGFGEVFQAFDDDLDRPVAIKVPRPERVSQPEDIEAYLAKPALLRASTTPISCLFMTWVAPTTVCASWSRSSSRDATLRGRSRKADPASTNQRHWWQGSPKPCTYAHTRGLVHRDIKPAQHPD